MSVSYHSEDTIVAIASAAGGAYRGIVRLSGQRAADVLSPIFHGDGGTRLSTRGSPSALQGGLQTSQFAQPIPCLVYHWPTKRSFTRQPTIEIHTIGSAPLLEAIIRAMCAQGARLAEPGEFTLRAFLAGRIDLTQAEAVLGVIDAGGEKALQNALAQLAGGLSTPLAELRSRLLDLLAHLEAGLDFVDEDIEFISSEEMIEQLTVAESQVQQLLKQMEVRTVADGKFRVVLIGLPNAGKSSLFNLLVRRQQAIVSPVKGTTRDFVTGDVEYNGMTFKLIDTAGAEAVVDDDSISQKSQGAMHQQLRSAHLRVLCVDVSHPAASLESIRADLFETADLIALTKVENQSPACRVAFPVSIPVIATSAHAGRGALVLCQAIVDCLRTRHAEADGAIAATAVRCRGSLEHAATQLQRARQTADARMGEELVAAEIRVALTDLAHVVGAIYTDDILDRVFSRFCIGK